MEVAITSMPVAERFTGDPYLGPLDDARAIRETIAEMSGWIIVVADSYGLRAGAKDADRSATGEEP